MVAARPGQFKSATAAVAAGRRDARLYRVGDMA